MGANSSKAFNTPLHQNEQPLVAISAKHVAPTPVTLVIRPRPKSWLKNDFTVCDATSGKEVLRVDGSAQTMRDEMALVDSHTNQTVAHTKHSFFTTSKAIHLWSARDNILLAEITRRFQMNGTSQVVAAFRNAHNGQHVALGMKGDSDHAIIWFAQGDGERLPVARIRRGVNKKTELTVEISSNLDQALVVWLCVAFDLREKILNIQY